MYRKRRHARNGTTTGSGDQTQYASTTDLEGADDVDELVRVLLVDLNVEGVHAAKLLEQHSLALLHIRVRVPHVRHSRLLTPKLANKTSYGDGVETIVALDGIGRKQLDPCKVTSQGIEREAPG